MPGTISPSKYRMLLGREGRESGLLARVFADRKNADEGLEALEEFLCSLGDNAVVRGAYIYKRGKVRLNEYDTLKHKYTFSVSSEDSPNQYMTGFCSMGAGGKELEVADLAVGCTCRWLSDPRTRSGSARICKHMFAAMLYLLHNKPHDLPVFRQLVRLVFFAEAYAKPSRSTLDRISREEPEAYEETRRKLLESLSAREKALIASPSIAEKQAVKELVESLREPGGRHGALSAYEYDTALAVRTLLNYIIGGTGTRHLKNWMWKVFHDLSGDRPVKTLYKVKSMEEQRRLMENFAGNQKGQELKNIVGQALEIWGEGILSRQEDMRRGMGAGGSSHALSERTLRSALRELGLVLKLWRTHDYIHRLVSGIAEEATGMEPRDALNRLRK